MKGVYIEKIDLFNKHTGCILGFDRGGHAKIKKRTLHIKIFPLKS